MRQQDVDSLENLQQVIVPVLGSVVSVYSVLSTDVTFSTLVQASIALQSPLPLPPVAKPLGTLSATICEKLTSPHSNHLISLAGFAQPDCVMALGDYLIKALVAFRTVLLFNQLCSTEIISPTVADGDSIANLKQRLMHHLTTIPQLPQRQPLSLIQDSTRLTMLICLMMTYTSFSPQSYYTQMLAHRLQLASARMLQTGKVTHSILRLSVWILCIGALISHELTERSWFIVNLAQIGARLNLKTPENLRGLMDSFFNPHFEFLERVEDIWEETEMAASALGLGSERS